jgi:hypothetical protein
MSRLDVILAVVDIQRKSTLNTCPVQENIKSFGKNEMM